MFVSDERPVKDLIDSSVQRQLYRWVDDDDRPDNRAAIRAFMCGFLVLCGYLLLSVFLGVVG